MADYTAEQYREAARKAMAAGDTAGAQRLIAAGRALPASAPGNTVSGVASQFGAGSQSGIASGLGFPVDALTGVINLVPRGINAIAGTDIPTIQNPVGGSQSIKSALKPFNDFIPPPQTALERGARRTGEEVGASAAMLPAMLATAPARAAPAAAAAVEGVSALGSGVGASVANELAPGSTTADIIGSLIGGVSAGLPAAKYAGLNGDPAKIRGGIADQKMRAADAYGEVRADQRVLPQNSVDDMALDLSAKMDAQRINPRLQPGSNAVLDAVLQDSSKPMRIEDMENLRRLTQQGLPATAAPSDRRLAGMMTDDITKYLDDLGDPVADRLKEGRDAHRRALAAQSVQEAATKAARRAARTGSGGNEINATRQNISQLIENPRKAKSFKPAELAAMDDIVMGSAPQNAARRLSRFAPSSGGLSAMLGMGGAIAAPQFALPIAALTEGARAFGEGSTRKSINALMQSLAPDRVLKPGEQGIAAQIMAMLAARTAAKERD
jgi:hypothetical protein